MSDRVSLHPIGGGAAQESRRGNFSCRRDILSAGVRKLTEQDKLGVNFVPALDGEEQMAKSIFGSICSLLILLTTVLYAYQKLDVLVNKKDLDVKLQNITKQKNINPYYPIFT